MAAYACRVVPRSMRATPRPFANPMARGSSEEIAQVCHACGTTGSAGGGARGYVTDRPLGFGRVTELHAASAP